MEQIKVLVPKVTLHGENKHSFFQRVTEEEERIQTYDVVVRQVLKEENLLYMLRGNQTV